MAGLFKLGEGVPTNKSSEYIDTVPEICIATNTFFKLGGSELQEMKKTLIQL